MADVFAQLVVRQHPATPRLRLRRPALFEPTDPAAERGTSRRMPVGPSAPAGAGAPRRGLAFPLDVDPEAAARGPGGRPADAAALAGEPLRPDAGVGSPTAVGALPGETRRAPAPPDHRAPESGPPVSGPPVSGPPESGPPVSGRPESGPPVSGPPVSGPPVSGLPAPAAPRAGHNGDKARSFGSRSAATAGSDLGRADADHDAPTAAEIATRRVADRTGRHDVEESGAASSEPPIGRRLTAAELLRRHLAPALTAAGHLSPSEAERLSAVPSTGPLPPMRPGRWPVRLDPVDVQATGELHLHIDRVEITKPEPPPASPAPPAPVKVDHTAYLERQARRS